MAADTLEYTAIGTSQSPPGVGDWFRFCTKQLDRFIEISKFLHMFTRQRSQRGCLPLPPIHNRAAGLEGRLTIVVQHMATSPKPALACTSSGVVRRMDGNHAELVMVTYLLAPSARICLPLCVWPPPFPYLPRRCRHRLSLPTHRKTCHRHCRHMCPVPCHMLPPSLTRTCIKHIMMYSLQALVLKGHRGRCWQRLRPTCRLL